MPLSRIDLRLFITLLGAVLPPIVVFHFMSSIWANLVVNMGSGTVLALALLGGILWIALVSLVAGPFIGEEARSMAAIAERGRAGESEEEQENQSAAQRRLATALEDRNRQIAELAAWSASTAPAEDARRVASTAVDITRLVTGDPTWVLAVTVSSNESLLPTGVYGPDADSIEPIAELHQWAATTEEATAGPVAVADGPWGAFAVVRVRSSREFNGSLIAPWEGRTAPSQAEAQLLALVAEHVSSALDHAVLYSRLRAQAEQLDRMHAVQRDFLRSVTHDLQTPLTRIAALAEEVSADTQGNSQALDDLNMIRSQAERLRRMVGQLLVVSRLEAGAVTTRQEIVRPVQLVQTVWAVLRPPARQLDVNVGSDALAIADPDRLEQVLWAILDNAVKYSPGGGSIQVSYTSRPRTRDADGAPGDEGSDLIAELRITDSGIGMDPATTDRAFEQFYRADSARQLVPDGSGVGLYAARGLVELMGGRMGVESQLGHGTSVTISLPAEEAAIGTGSDPVPIADR
jgi:signal transduction histidine kinase